MDNNITTPAGEVFTPADSADLAWMIYRRFGRDFEAGASAWRRLLGNSCSRADFERLARASTLYTEFHRQPTAKRRAAPPQLPGKRDGSAGPARNLPVLHVPQGSAKLPDLRGWTNRFEIRSESSDRIYIVSQNIENRHWGCSCPAWRTRRACKHLAALCLPAHEQPYEARLA